MKYVQGMEYEVEFSDHAMVMLAFRYGIALEGGRQTIYFSRMLQDPSATNTKIACRIHLNGRAIKAVLYDHTVVTVLPSRQTVNSTDAARIASGFDMVFAVSPGIFPLTDIVEWREKYHKFSGSLNVDDLRREVKSRAKAYLVNQEQSNSIAEFQKIPMEHVMEFDSVELQVEYAQMDSFYSEVIELRERLFALQVQTIDFSSKESVEEAAYYSRLAKTPQTLTYTEANPPSPEELEEILHESCEEDHAFLRQELMQELRYQAHFGLPDEGTYIDKTPSNHRVFCHLRCVVVDVVYADDPSDPWHEIIFMDEGKNYFVMTTKIKKYIDSYKTGDVGIWSIEYGSIRYLHPRPPNVPPLRIDASMLGALPE